MNRVETALYWVRPIPPKQPNIQQNSPKLQDLRDLSSSPARPQTACLLFRIPREIRDQVFALAVTTYKDFSKPFEKDYIRPASQCRMTIRDEGWPRHREGHQHKRYTDIALLKTCRKIYRETRLLPVSVNEHSLIYSANMGFDTPLPLNGAEYFNRMTPEQLAAVQHVQIFAHRHLLCARDPGTYPNESVWAELGFLRNGGGEGYRSRPHGHPWDMLGPFYKSLTITVGWNDWGPPGVERYGLDMMLLNLHWQNVLGGVKLFKVELEKVAAEKAPLEWHIKRLLCTDFDIGNGEVLVPERCAWSHSWTGQKDHGRRGAPDWKETEFCVQSVTWHVKKRHDDSEDYSFLGQ